MAAATDRRGLLPRFGICALNLLLPGLGLVRLARYRLAGVFFAVVIASMLVLLGGYWLIEHMSFGEWAFIVGSVCALTLVAWLGSTAASWRSSKMLEPRGGKAWRWYGILGIWAASIAATWFVGDLAHSRYKGFYAPAESMLPTIEVDDRFLADMHHIDPIARGDVVIVRSNGVDYVKRVAGLPGDTIALSGGKVVLNGKPVALQFIDNMPVQVDLGILRGAVSREQFPGEAKPHLVMDTGPSVIDDFAEVTLPPDRYFVLGDNRDHSADSRLPAGFESGLGLVGHNAIIGRFLFRYWRKGAGAGPEGS
jgi:signal peptidase I